jgi:transcriptional regulator with XRE-family HTH domain
MKNVKDIDDFNENFYELILRELDKKSSKRGRKITYSEFCKEIGMSLTHFSHFMNGDINLHTSTIIRILDYLGYDLSFKVRRKSPKG